MRLRLNISCKSEALMEKQYEIFARFLERKGLKMTRSRRTILQAVFETHDHFHADQLYEQIRKQDETVSRATVYRTIPLLVETGLVKQSMRRNSKNYYEHIYGHPSHLHLICARCGSIYEEKTGSLEKELRMLCEKRKFRMDEFSITIKGLCRKCMERKV